MVEKKLDESFLTPSSPKVIALYDAVTALSREGADLTRLKVSDIAAKAGIGKGTTYAYFKSREELIVKAVLYDIYNHLRIIQSRICQVESFQEKVYVMLDVLFEAEDSDTNIFQRLMPVFHDIGSFPARFQEEFMKCAPGMTEIEKMFQVILKAAEAEGIAWKNLNLFYVQNAFVNTIMNYACYKRQAGCRKQFPEIPEAEVKKRLYENLVFMLRE